MKPIESSEHLNIIHSDIRGPVFEKAMEMRAQGIDVLRLNTGNPATFGFEMPASVRKALLENADKAVAYCDAKGMPEAREAIWKYHTARGIQNLTVNDIFIGNGVSELAPMICNSILNPGDELLMPSPSYSLWSNSAILAGGKPVFYTCDEKSDWNPDLADLKSKITPRTKAVLLINPNNPTGAIYPAEILQAVIALCREHNLLLISDEIYDRLIMDDHPFTSTAALAPDLPVITTNGLSKSHIICGFRCGWAAVSGPAELKASLVQNLGKLSAMRLCGNALAQLTIPAALADPESTKAMLVPGGRIYEQRAAACRALDRIEGLTYVKPKAAFYVFPHLDERFRITNDKQFALDFLAAKHVLLVAGSGFDWPKPDHFRLVLLPEPREIEHAIDALGDFLKTYRQ